MESTKKNKCAHCKKKLGMMAFKCKCGKKYCITHLQAEIHDCKYDYRENATKKLEKDLIKVVNTKIIPI